MPDMWDSIYDDVPQTSLPGLWKGEGVLSVDNNLTIVSCD